RGQADLPAAVLAGLVTHRTLLVGDQNQTARHEGTHPGSIGQCFTKIVNTVSNSDARGWFAYCGYAMH
ncbi:MAG: hypothetical protein JWQ21_3290, partial [Herminiimonas sp.]|nr:hypothetical protein [Herminiimonas sp.]